MKIFIKIALFACLPFGLQAQNVTGTVYDASSKQTLQGATILQKETQNGTAADAQGRFTLKLTNEGPKIIEVSFLGYKSQSMAVPSRGFSDRDIYLIPDEILAEEILVRALRADESTPMTYTNVEKAEIEQQNLGQDMPYLLQFTPSVVTTSDAGAGVGYTGIRIRGVDPTRINVTINGIPLNDSESHGVFWVNTPDLASSVNSIQIQRGVGTSTNGTAAFGASINLETSTLTAEPFGTLTSSIGSFGTTKINGMIGTGLLKNGWSFEGRASNIQSDGYIDRASSDLNSYFLAASRFGKNSLLKINVFGGDERTYQAWYGTPESRISGNVEAMNAFADRNFLSPEDRRNLLESGRTYNFYTYDNQVDDYAQDHYQIHYSYRFSELFTSNISLHYTKGSGFFEEYRSQDDLSIYGIGPITIGNQQIINADVVRRRWLDNDFYGFVSSAEYSRDRFNLTFGGGYNVYDGDHFGEVIWAQFAGDSQPEQRYYDNNGFKTDGNIYAKASYRLTEELLAFGDVQFRGIYYRFLGFDQNLNNVTQDDRLVFFNPKAGLVYQPSPTQRLFASFSVGGREPTRNEYVESTPQSRPDPERLYDWEVGYQGAWRQLQLAINGYYMYYQDQLILTGAVNDVGAYVRQNVPASYRLGIEFQTLFTPAPWFEWEFNSTFSRNKIDEFTEYVDDFDNGGQQATIYRNTDIAFSPSIIVNNRLGLTYRELRVDVLTKYVSEQYLDNRQDANHILEAYSTTDLRLSYEFVLPAYISTLRINALANNVLDHLYETNGYTFGYIAGGQLIREDFFYPQAGRNFLIQVQLNF